jgi:hypothetical protein
MLASSIGFLFVTQMMIAAQNITTLESFTDGITEHVRRGRSRMCSTEVPSPPT